MALIPMKEYAEKNNRHEESVRHMIKLGKVESTIIDGKRYIDEDFPYPQRMEDLTGRKFGKLTVIEHYKTENRVVYWKCRCDCGNEKIAISKHLKRGEVKSCGCLPRGMVGRSVEGQKFGKLTPIRSTGQKGKHYSVMWECKCDCGKICYVSASDLLDKTKSCGCGKSDAGKRNHHIAIEGLKRHPKTGKFETNIAAKHWKLIDPNGKIYEFDNLLLWAREHTHLFGMENEDRAVEKIHSGFSRISQTLAGSKSIKAYSYKGWTLQGVSEFRNKEKWKKLEAEKNKADAKSEKDEK